MVYIHENYYQRSITQKGISRYELAKRIGVTYPTITNLYNGKTTSIKLEILENLCKELNCTPNDIIYTEDKQLIKLINDKNGSQNI